MYQRNVFAEQSRKVSPEQQQLDYEEDPDYYSSAKKIQKTFIPDSRSQIKDFNTGTYNSPIRGSYSARRQKRKSHMMMQKSYSTKKINNSSSQKGYSNKKMKENVNLISNSRQSPTFRPKNGSSAATNSKRCKPPIAKK